MLFVCFVVFLFFFVVVCFLQITAYEQFLVVLKLRVCFVKLFFLDFSIKRFVLWYTSGSFQMFFQQAPREWPHNIDFEKGQIGSDPEF